MAVLEWTVRILRLLFSGETRLIWVDPIDNSNEGRLDTQEALHHSDAKSGPLKRRPEKEGPDSP